MHGRVGAFDPHTVHFIVSHKFFENDRCKFYPCHDLKEINCLFCFCPIFFFKNCGGAYSILKDGTKDCSKCVYPHREVSPNGMARARRARGSHFLWGFKSLDLRLFTIKIKEIKMKKVKVNTDFERLQLKARDALNFLEGHPAMSCIVIDVMSSLWFSIQTVCKRGYSDYACKSVKVYKNSKEASRFKDRFDKELKNYNEEELKTQGPFVSIDVSYKELFGEEWAFDHVEYWGELSFYMFKGNPTDKNNIERKNWQSYCGVEAGGRTFEEMIVKITEKFKEAFGKFDKYDFLTKEENENNKDKEPFIFKQVKREGSSLKYSTMVRNRKYKHVNDAGLNLRWQKWYKTTKHYKKNWERK